MEATARYLESKRSKLQSQSAKVAVVLYYEGFEQVDEFQCYLERDMCGEFFATEKDYHRETS